MTETQLGINQVVKMVATAQRRPQSRLLIKLTGIVLSCQGYERKDGTGINYNCQFWHNETESLIPFYSAVPFDKGKKMELEFVLSGFSATIAKHPGVTGAK